jgi:hypothetical protein
VARSSLATALFVLALVVCPSSAQVAPGPGGRAGVLLDTLAIPENADDTLSNAREAQRRFERLRRQWSPVTRRPWSGSDCDEIVGRICLRHREGSDWWPQPEDARLVEARCELLATLERSASFLPREPWIVGQRVLYLVEAGRWAEAEALARACLPRDPARCGGFLGLALHGQGRFQDAERAFRSGIASIEEDRRAVWSDPRVVLDLRAEDAYEDALDRGPLSAPALEEVVWRLADPLYLVPGNDRLTEHWARRVWASIKQGTANPYGMSWGRDLEEVLVRYGWEVGWERAVDTSARMTPDAMVGHHHPESRGYMPPAEVLRDLAGSTAGVWRLSVARPRDGYAPAYAPVILPLEGELLRFPRGDRMTVVAVYALPDDTTHHAKHEHPPFEPPEAFRGRSLEAGLFLTNPAGDEVHEARRSDAPQGALILDAPSGDYFASLEVWDPGRGFAARLRLGVKASTPATVSLSDLMLLEGPLADTARLEEAVTHARQPGAVPSGEPLSFGWEVFGLGDRSEAIAYRVSLARESRGLLQNLGQWLGVSRPEEPVRISWEEPGPAAGPSFRTLTVDLPQLDDGEYLLRLELDSPGRATLSSERRLQVRNR